MTKEEYKKIYAEKTAQIYHLKSELLRMKKEFIREHQHIKQLPVKIHFIQQIKDRRNEIQTYESDAYVINYDILENIVYPVLKEVKKNGEMSSREYHYCKYGIFKYWEIGKEDVVYEIDFKMNND